MLHCGFIRPYGDPLFFSFSENKNQWREIPEENNGGF